MLFDKDSYSKPISEKLSEYLRDWTNKQDRADVSRITKIGLSTIRDVVYRNNSLTEENSKAIVELMKIAVVNCTNKIAYAKKVKRVFGRQLKS